MEPRQTLDLSIKDFQSENNRLIEENFAQILTERSGLRFFFINEDSCFTDGQNIIVDPAFLGLYKDKKTLSKVEKHLNLSDEISNNQYLALKMSARVFNIHESLHIIYSDFPPPCNSDERATTKTRKKTLGIISNIIEDAFIEAAGCSVYDNLEHLLLWLRLGVGYKQGKRKIENIPLLSYLNYMTEIVLYPFFEMENPIEEIKEYIEKTKQLYLDGSICGESKMRYTYSQKIFDIIEPLIPKEEDGIEGSSIEELEKQLEELSKNKLAGFGTHSGENVSIANITSQGKTAAITRARNV
jgi:hypothetical protein